MRFKPGFNMRTIVVVALSALLAMMAVAYVIQVSVGSS
jgi:hypothetical protein